MATITRRGGMRARQWPGAVIDLWGVPSARGVATGAASASHLLGELVAVRVLVAIGASPRLDPKVIPRSLAPMTAAARNRLVFALQLKIRSGMLGNGKKSRPKPVLIVASRAIRRAEFASMGIAVTVGALRILQASIATRRWQLGEMATIARDLGVHAFQGESGHRMRAKPDASRQAQPPDVGVAALALVSKFGFVDLRMARNTLCARGRGLRVASVVTGLAFGLGMTASEAQTGMIAPGIGDLAPIGLVVA